MKLYVVGIQKGSSRWVEVKFNDQTNIEDVKTPIFDGENLIQYPEPTREVNAKIPIDIILEIINDLKKNEKSIKEISKKYECSALNIFRIRNKIEHYLKPRNHIHTIKLRKRDKMELINIIEQFESKILTPFSVKNIQNEIVKRVGINYPKSLLYKIMKSECSLSYKRICSRPKRNKSAILLPSRSLFWSKLLCDLTQET